MQLPSAPAGRFKAIALGRGAAVCGIVAAADIAEHARFSIAAETLPVNLGYVQRGLAKRKNLNIWFPGAASALVCAFPYWDAGHDYAAELAAAGDLEAFLRASGRRVNHPELLKKPGAQISRYALAPDYHITVVEKLSAMLADIKKEFPGAEGKTFCDTSPVMEKELARQAGLGFRGRNTLLISPSLGSYFFIGGIALNLPLEADMQAAGGCGNCRLCEAACPTKALSGGRLDAGRCVSYWSTQAKAPVPADIASASLYAYGCDHCQQACPYNQAK